MKQLALALFFTLPLSPLTHAQEELFNFHANGVGFGRRVAIDEGLLAVTTNSGLVHLHDAESGQHLMQLSGSDGHPSFGGVVALGDGYLVVGAGYHSNGEGRVYVLDSATGVERYQLGPPPGQGDDLFGWAVATDGGRILVGAPDDDDLATNAGTAYLYDAASGQLLRQFQQSVVQFNQGFGQEVALDGDYVLVGAGWENVAGGDNNGAAYLFDANTGQLLHRFRAANTVDYDYFGNALDVEAPFVVIGSPVNSAAVHVFDLLSGTQLHLVQNPGTFNSYFGDAVDIDGTRALIGAERDNNYSGGAYVIDLVSGSVEYALAPSSYGFFGSGVALEGTLAYAGAPSSNAGLAYAFSLDDLGDSYCEASVNSTANASTLYVAGSESAADQELELIATNAPPAQAAVFFVGTAPNQVPFGDGLLCAAGAVTRLGAPVFELAGQFEAQVDFGGAGAVLGAGQWYFQCWYRDPAGGGAGFNLSDGVGLLLMP